MHLILLHSRILPRTGSITFFAKSINDSTADLFTWKNVIDHWLLLSFSKVLMVLSFLLVFYFCFVVWFLLCYMHGHFVFGFCAHQFIIALLWSPWIGSTYEWLFSSPGIVPSTNCFYVFLSNAKIWNAFFYYGPRRFHLMFFTLESTAWLLFYIGALPCFAQVDCSCCFCFCIF